jgi:phosphoglycolate phosphatase
MDDTAVAQATMDRLGITAMLDFLAGADAGFGTKPEMGMVLGFCAACAVDPAQVMVVGDTPADLVMARRAGCAAAVAVGTGAMSLERLAALADHLLPSVQAIETLLPMPVLGQEGGGG